MVKIVNARKSTRPPVHENYHQRSTGEPQCLVNAVIGKVDRPEKRMSGKATYQELTEFSRRVLQVVGRYALPDDVASVPIRWRFVFGKESIQVPIN